MCVTCEILIANIRHITNAGDSRDILFGPQVISVAGSFARGQQATMDPRANLFAGHTEPISDIPSGQEWTSCHADHLI